MALDTGISWADSTLNIWAGCTKVSVGALGACEGCYAEHLMDHRLGRAKWGPRAARIEMKGWRAQLRAISRKALAAGRPWFVFVNSLSDFWDNQADPTLRAEALAEFRKHPHLTFLLLTKRPQNILRMAREVLGYGDCKCPVVDWPSNIAIGCTVVTQDEADRDVPWLLEAKALLKPAFAFLSMEPLLGPVDLTAISTMRFRGGEVLNALTGKLDGMFGDPAGRIGALDWVITGGETAQGQHKARPSHPDWFRSLRDQCAAAGVAYHHKQNGEWVRLGAVTGRARDAGKHCFEDQVPMLCVGKARAGRLLSGKTHDARPMVTA